MNALLSAIGLKEDAFDRKRTACSFRHTYASSQIRKGTEIYVLAINMRTSALMHGNPLRYVGNVLRYLRTGERAPPGFNRQRESLGRFGIDADKPPTRGKDAMHLSPRALSWNKRRIVDSGRISPIVLLTTRLVTSDRQCRGDVRD